jgi:hypothetical protein
VSKIVVINFWTMVLALRGDTRPGKVYEGYKDSGGHLG